MDSPLKRRPVREIRCEAGFDDNSMMADPGWPEEWTRALSDASLRQASSAAIFQRGKTYAASGAVEVISENPLPEPLLRAQVIGTELYTTEVWIEDGTVAGQCDCPNAEDRRYSARRLCRACASVSSCVTTSSAVQARPTLA